MTTAILIALRKGVHPEAGSVAVVLIPCALLVPIALVAYAAGLDGSAEGLWRFALVGLISPGLALITYTHAIDAAGASRVGILIGTAPVLSAVLAVSFLDERLGAILAVATILIVAGSVVLAWDESRPPGFRRSGIVLGAITALLFSIQANVARWAAEGGRTHYLYGVATIMASGSAVMVAYWLLRRRSLNARLSRPVLRAFLPPGVLFALAYLTFVIAYERGRVTVVAPLTATESLWTVVFAALLVGRARDAIGPRVVTAAVLVTVGSMLVGLFR